jgi:hypothetical protein
MLFNSFWKRLFILNIVILIVLFRIFNVLEKYFKKHSYNNSLFPILTEDGYPFFNAINCDIKQLTSITKHILDNHNNINDFIFPDNKLLSKECSFIDKYILCKDNKACLNKINNINEEELFCNNKIDKYFIENVYHSKINNNRINDVIGISSLINIMNNKNEFISDKNNKIEILFYNKIISGYYSFLFFKQYDNNIKNNIHSGDTDFTNYNILKQITQDENRLNDLFYLYSLILYSYNKSSKDIIDNSTEAENNHFYLNFANECIDLSDDKFELTKYKIIPRNKKIFEDILMNQVNNLFDCLYNINEKNSFNIDITAIHSMIKILSDDKNISDYEKYSISLFLVELSKMINNIFTAEINLNNKIGVLRQNYVYIIIIYGCSSLAIIFFINKYFLKNKNKYENQKRKKELIMKQKYGNIGNDNLKDKQFIKYENNNNNNKLTEEELEYVQKLAKENKADFVIAK